MIKKISGKIGLATIPIRFPCFFHYGVELFVLWLVYQGDGSASLTGPGCPADPMDVSFDEKGTVVGNHVTDLPNVDSSGQRVSGHQEVHSSSFELQAESSVKYHRIWTQTLCKGTESKSSSILNLEV